MSNSQDNPAPVPLTLTIGYKLPDGSYKVLATLDNRDHGLPTASFLELAGNIHRFYMHTADSSNQYEILHREDAPSTVEHDAENAAEQVEEMAPAG